MELVLVRLLTGRVCRGGHQVALVDCAPSRPTLAVVGAILIGGVLIGRVVAVDPDKIAVRELKAFLLAVLGGEGRAVEAVAGETCLISRIDGEDIPCATHRPVRVGRIECVALADETRHSWAGRRSGSRRRSRASRSHRSKRDVVLGTKARRANNAVRPPQLNPSRKIVLVQVDSAELDSTCSVGAVRSSDVCCRDMRVISRVTCHAAHVARVQAISVRNHLHFNRGGCRRRGVRKHRADSGSARLDTEPNVNLNALAHRHEKLVPARVGRSACRGVPTVLVQSSGHNR